MKKAFLPICFFSLFILLLCYSKLYSQSIPHLQKKGTTQQLIVDGKPFSVLGGELGNSTASSLNYMRPFWQKFKVMNLNTILVPAYWDLIEPEEGKFNFDLVDSIINTSQKI